MTFDYLKTAYAVLDKYDFTEVIKKGKEKNMDFYDFYDLIVESYPAPVSIAFDDLDSGEIMDYFYKKYDLRWYEVVKYHL